MSELREREKPWVDAAVKRGESVPCYAMRGVTPSMWSIEHGQWLAIGDDGMVPDPRAPPELCEEAVYLTVAEARDLREMLAEYRRKKDTEGGTQ